MSDRRFPSEPGEMVRGLGTQLVPVDEAERVEQRRQQVIRALSRAIRANADQKRSTRARLLMGLGLAASLALGIGAAARFRHHPQEPSMLSATVAEVHG